jgi:hypothetical protein
MPKNEKLVSALQQPPGQRVSPGIYRNAQGQNVRWNPGQPQQAQQQMPQMPQGFMENARRYLSQMPQMPAGMQGEPYQAPEAGQVRTMERPRMGDQEQNIGRLLGGFNPYQGQDMASIAGQMQPGIGRIDPGFNFNQMPQMPQEQAPGERVSPGLYRTPSGEITRWNPKQNNFPNFQSPQQPTPMPRGGYNWGQVSGGAQQPMPIPAAFQGIGYKR